jgi:glycine/D-amino acid oxidase-like deaminating enzyme
MHLRTGNLLWPVLSPPRVIAERLRRGIRCDAVILGAGVSGAMAGCELAAAGLDTVIIDRRGVAHGSTPASTALLLYEIDTPLIELAELVGPAAAARAYCCCRRVLDDLANLVERHRVDCDLHWTGSLYLADDDHDRDWFQREQEARAKLRIEVELLDHDELMERFDIDRPAALFSLAAIEADPFKLTHGLLKAARDMGARVYEADVTIDESNDAENVLTTSDGLELRCKHLVVATGYETPHRFRPLRSLCSIHTTYALASEPIEGEAWPGRALIWEAASPYLYARQTADNRVIIGGADEIDEDAGRDDATLTAKMAELLDKLASLRPGLHVQPACVWAGAFAQTRDGLPFIGTHPRWPRVHFALGYGGNGITFSLLAAQINRDAILGRTNPDAAIFGFDRNACTRTRAQV